MPIGLHSAGLKKRATHEPVIVAGIQSVYQKACELDRFDLILIDECHTIPAEGDGRYRTFLADAKKVNPNVRLIGMTATPYRMKSGMLCGRGHLLDEVCYEVGVRRLIEQGYLCPLRSKAGRRKVDTGGLHLRGGEFIASEVAELMDDDFLVDAACRELVLLTEERASVLIFAASVAHAEHIQAKIEKLSSTECGLVTGNTPPQERADLIARFKGEKPPSQLFDDFTRLKYLVNVNVLTTGFDAPNVDTVVLLRPTASPGLYYQMVGRGFRLHPRKEDCLVLDYGGNIERHGPVDAIEIRHRQSGQGDAPVKECPECRELVPAGTAVCPDCGHRFPPPERERHESVASRAGILSGEETTHPVQGVDYRVHIKRGADEGAPKTMRVDYHSSLTERYSEWVCPEHTGWARRKFEAWWRERSHTPPPDSADEAVERALEGVLAEPSEITVRTGGEFPRITQYRLGPDPATRGLAATEAFLSDECSLEDIPF